MIFFFQKTLLIHSRGYVLLEEYTLFIYVSFLRKIVGLSWESLKTTMQIRLYKETKNAKRNARWPKILSEL